MKVNPTNVPSKRSTAAEWINWHKALKSNFGKKVANDLFLKAWRVRGGKGSDANTNELRSYLEKNGIVIDRNLVASITDTAYDLGDSIADTFKIGKYATIVIGVIVVGSVGLLLFNIARQPIAAAGAAAKLTPAGRMKK